MIVYLVGVAGKAQRQAKVVERARVESLCAHCRTPILRGEPVAVSPFSSRYCSLHFGTEVPRDEIIRTFGGPAEGRRP